MLSCIALFVLCSLARLFEYFVLRTDETILAENVLHKVFGILALAVMLHGLHGSWQSIGFKKAGAASGLAKGFLLGGCCFAIAYAVEYLLLYHANQNAALSFYVSGFSLNGQTTAQNGVLYIVLCLVFNLINVWMEEGVFRGLFMNLLTEKLSFLRSALFSALLFGVWHWVMPLRDYVDGNTSPANLLGMGMGYIVLAGMMSLKWSLLYEMTGTLWMGLGDHFFNNVIVTNLLHVVSNGEADRMQIVRIMTGQVLSFAAVLAAYRKNKREQQPPKGQ